SPSSCCRSRSPLCSSARCSRAPLMSSPVLAAFSGRTLVRLRYAAPKIFATLFALLLAAVWIGPLALMVITSIKPNKEFLNGPFSLPIAPNFDAYVKVWQGLHFGVLMQNSLLYAALGSALAGGPALFPALRPARFRPPG